MDFKKLFDRTVEWNLFHQSLWFLKKTAQNVDQVVAERFYAVLLEDSAVIGHRKREAIVELLEEPQKI